MLDTPTKDMAPAPGWRFPRFLRFGENGDETARPKATKPPKEPEDRKHHFAVWYVFAAFLGVMLIQYVWLIYTQVETVPYSQFEQLLNENKISEVLVGHDSIQGTLKQPLPDGRKLFYTVRVDPALADMLKAHGVTITGEPSSNFLSTILSWALPIFLFYLIWTYGVRRMAERQGLGGLMTIGKSRAKIYVETDTKVTFKDVAGVDEAKYELQEVVAFLRDPKSFGRLGARIPKGVLLDRTAGHRKDAAGARSRRRGGRAVFLDLGLRVRRDVRRRRRRARSRPVRAGAEGGALHHLHRRARCAGAKPRLGRLRRLRREGADAQSAARRTRRLRCDERRDPDRRHQSPGGARSGLAEARAFRPPGAGRPAGSRRGGCKSSRSTSPRSASRTASISTRSPG